MCPKRVKGKRVTCSDKCLSALRTKLVAENRRKGIGWGGMKFGKLKKDDKKSRKKRSGLD